MKILNDYYAKADRAHSSSDGAGGGIVGMLEVIESDFTKTTTEMVAAEQMAADTYEKDAKEAAVAKTTKEQDVKYKTKVFIGIDKKVGESTNERSGDEDELNAVNE